MSDDLNQLDASAAGAADVTTLLTRIGDPSAHTLTSLTAKFGNLARSLTTIIGTRWNAAGDIGTDIASMLASLATLLTNTARKTVTNISVGAADYNAAPVTVLDITPAAILDISGLYLNISGFTNGATLTITYKIKSGVANGQAQFERTTIKSATNTLFPAIDSDIPLKVVASALVVAVQSDNAGDNAVTLTGSYFTR